MGKIERRCAPGVQQLLVAGGGGGIKPSPGGWGELKAGWCYRHQVGGQGEIMKKGEIGQMAFAADGLKAWVLSQPQAVTEQRHYRRRQPAAMHWLDGLPLVGGMDGG